MLPQTDQNTWNSSDPRPSEYTLNGSYCHRALPTILAVPIVYNTTASTHTVMADMTSTLVSATLAVHTINALFQERDKPLLGLTDEEEIRDEEPDKHGLSLGARIGISISVSIVGLALIGLGIWLLRRRRKNSKRQKAHEMTTVTQVVGPESHPYNIGPRSIGASTSTVYGAGDRHVANDSDDSDNPGRDGEIMALRAQKAAIQRRIEELESTEASDEHQGR